MKKRIASCCVPMSR